MMTGKKKRGQMADALDRASKRRQAPRQPSMAVGYSRREFEPMQAALAATKAAGCTCAPDITIDGDEATIKHDYWCAVMGYPL